MSRQEKETVTRTTTTDNPDPTPVETVPGPTVTDVERHERVTGPVTWEEMRSLLRREPTMYERTWRPTVGGLLEILAGSWNFLMGLSSVITGSNITSFINSLLPNVTVPGNISSTFITTGAVLMVLGIVSIIGGALALARRGWPMVLAGSITALIPNPLVLPFIMGFFALIFNVLGHKEFWGPVQVQKDIQSNIQHNIDKS